MKERATRGRRCVAALLASLAMASLFLSPAGALRFELESGHTKCVTEDIKLHAMAVGKYSVVIPSDAAQLPDSHKITVKVTSPYGNSIHYEDRVESGTFAFSANEEGDYLACVWAPYHQPAATLTVEFEWRTGVAAKDWTNVAKKGQIEFDLDLETFCVVASTMDVAVITDSVSSSNLSSTELSELGLTAQSWGIVWFSHSIILALRPHSGVNGLGCHGVELKLDNQQMEGMELELKKLEDTVKSIHDEMFYLREREEQMQEMNRSTNSRMAWLSFLSLAVCLSVAGLQLWHLKKFFEKKKLL
ncbi:hypothetical protein ZIOFF_073630 [Zingiber officinale]|uniref:GOLD domain-containing protein n=1 Tax=Zingiber officinale TaxID=94328 RepID=A0A8J5C7N4_ZINOF|nr:hypothetical protein ZIOFF_073630 [Zingiber officinale]